MSESDSYQKPAKVMRMVADWVIGPDGAPYLLEIQRALGSGLADYETLYWPKMAAKHKTRNADDPETEIAIHAQRRDTLAQEIAKKTGVSKTVEDHPILTVIAGGGGAGDKRFAALLLQSLKPDGWLPALLPSAILRETDDLNSILRSVFNDSCVPPFLARGFIIKESGSGSAGNRAIDSYRDQESVFEQGRGGILQPFIVSAQRTFPHLEGDRVASVRSYHTLLVYDDGTSKLLSGRRFFMGASETLRHLEDGFPDLSHALGIFSNPKGVGDPAIYLEAISDDDPIAHALGDYMEERVSPRLVQLMEKPFAETLEECAQAIKKRNQAPEIWAFVDMIFNPEALKALSRDALEHTSQLGASLLMMADKLPGAEKARYLQYLSVRLEENVPKLRDGLSIPGINNEDMRLGIYRAIKSLEKAQQVAQCHDDPSPPNLPDASP